MRKIPSINMHPHLGYLFEIERYDRETKRYVFLPNAILLQDIIQYQIQVQEGTFRFTELAKWLLTHNQEFVQFYQSSHIPMSSRIASRRDRIEKCLQILVDLCLVEVEGKVESKRNRNINTELYRFNHDGIFMRQLLRRYELWEIELHYNRLRKESKETAKVSLKQLKDEIGKVNQELYHILVDNLLKYDKRTEPSLSYDELQDNRSSLIKMLESLIVNIMKRGLFDRFIKNVIIRLFYQKGSKPREFPSVTLGIFSDIVESGFQGLLSTFDLSEVLKHGDISKHDFFELWYVSFMELDEVTQKLILQHYKLAYENGKGFEYLNKGIELARIKYARQYDKVVLQVHCNHCIGSYKVLDTLELISLYLIGNYSEYMKCPRCGNEKAWYFTSLRDYTWKY